MIFDRIVAVDWSARSAPSPRRPVRDAIYICDGRHSGIAPPVYCRTRDAAMAVLRGLIDDSRNRGERILIGVDFGLGYPAGFARALTGRDSALAVWDWLADRIADAPDNANNRFMVAQEINRRFPGLGPFWGRPAGLALPDLPARGSLRHDHGLPERRAVEARLSGAQPMWKLYTTGSVGSQSLLGLPHMAALRRQYGAELAVWPIETGWQVPDSAVTLVEIWPTLWTRLAQNQPESVSDARIDPGLFHIPDYRQVWQVVAGLRALAPAALAELFACPPGLDDPKHVAAEEGWILGTGPGG